MNSAIIALGGLDVPQMQSLDELIAAKAIEYAEQIKAAAVLAGNEEEIRIKSERQLAFIQEKAGIKLEGKHEFTVASGRIDSVYSRVIIEYKNPKSPGDRIGPKANSPGSKKVVEQIKKRFYDMRHEHGHPLNSMFGVGLDGNHFLFVRFRDEVWDIQDPVEVNRVSAERFLWALFNLGTKGKAFSPDYLADDFGAEGGNTIAIAGIRALYDAIATTDNPKAQTFFSQWKILFGEVCGYDVDNPSDKIQKLAEFYRQGMKDSKPAELLFAVHTYYALFMKLMAAEIVAFFHNLPTPLQKIMQATTSNKLKREVEDLEAGSIFRHLNITNFLEGDLFAWYTAVWTEPIERLVRDMVARLDQYNPGTLSEDPSGSRDLLKKLYQQLLPKSVRHDLGEYYTPDWLADHVLNEIGYVGDPDKRLLDPACGSGTFLVMAINRIRKWYDENRERCSFDEGELGRKILTNVIGFDLNPLAVMAARTNYLIAIRDLIGHVAKVEIPVYLCDSILTPAEYGDLFTGNLGDAKEIKTAAARFLVPTEIANSPESVATYAEVLESCVRNGYSPEEFIQRCRDESLPVDAETLHADLYRELVKLDKANRNGVWARIIKNSFAPLFTPPVDFVAGNPPWVRWNYLPGEYRSDLSPLWKGYGLFAQKGFMARLATAELDFSMLYLYACVDKFLKTTGKLGFVITLEVFKSKGAGEGFRSFKLGQGGVPFRVYRVDDMVALKPFAASNKTAVVFIEKGEENAYPVPYSLWTKKQPSSDLTVAQDLEKVRGVTHRKNMLAKPIGSLTSAWQTLSANQEPILDKLKGQPAYRAHRGVAVDPYGVYLVRPSDMQVGKTLLVTNASDLGDIKVDSKTVPIEMELLYPAVRGKDIVRWNYTSELLALITNKSPRKDHQIHEREMRLRYPKTFEYLLAFKSQLLKRGTLWAFYGRDTNLREVPSDSGQGYFQRKRTTSDRSGAAVVQTIDVPFYAMRDIGGYSFADYKVVWQMGASKIKAAVVGHHESVLGMRPVIPCTGTVSYVACESSEEACYITACLNSILANLFFCSFSSAGRGLGAPSILQQIRLPKFDPSNPVHSELAELAARCHVAVESGQGDVLKECENKVDLAAAALWNVSAEELRTVLE